MNVLGALWRLKSGTVRDVLDELARQGRRLAYTTVLTLLGRLERKGCVTRTKSDGLAHVYRPRVSRERVMAARLGTMVKQLGDGEAAPLIMQLVQAHKLSSDDIRQLRQVLTALERQTGGTR
jgi:predicted transcriptional regulator